MFEKILNQVYKDMEFYSEIDDDLVKKLAYSSINQNDVTNMNFVEIEALIQRVFNHIKRLGVLQPLIEDDSITEIMVNGYKNIFVEKEGKIYKTDISFINEDEYHRILQKIVSEVNRSVNVANPIVDARLLDGSRVNIVLDSISLGGSALTIRKFSKKKFTLDDYVKLGVIDNEVKTLLEELIVNKYNIFISGGTGSGKTTLLNALSKEIPSPERIITIEDSAELQLEHINNWVRLEKRNSNSQNVGEISIRELIKTALRMRPDRIIVGEVRGEEALDMLQAMNTGHEGSLSTAHANSTKDMLIRLQTMVYSAAQIPMISIKQQISAAIDIMIHVGRMRDGSRKIVEIRALSDIQDGEIVSVPIYEFKENGMKDGKIIGKLVRTDFDFPRRKH